MGRTIDSEGGKRPVEATWDVGTASGLLDGDVSRPPVGRTIDSEGGKRPVEATWDVGTASGL